MHQHHHYSLVLDEIAGTLGMNLLLSPPLHGSDTPRRIQDRHMARQNRGQTLPLDGDLSRRTDAAALPAPGARFDRLVRLAAPDHARTLGSCHGLIVTPDLFPGCRSDPRRAVLGVHPAQCVLCNFKAYFEALSVFKLKKYSTTKLYNFLRYHMFIQQSGHLFIQQSTFEILQV